MISVLMASYNYETYLDEAISSVLAQTRQDLELLVIDDGSTDGSVALARARAAEDPRVRVLTHPDGANHGLPDTLYLGLAEARGEWIAFLESDDVWTPECLARRLERAEATGADAVFNDIRPLPMPGADTGWFDGYVPRVMREHLARGEKAFSLRSALLTENKIPTFSCIMVRTDRLRRCSFNAPVPRWLDWWLWAQIAAEGSFAFSAEKGTLWRLHSQSFNHKVSLFQYLKDVSSLWKGFRKRLLPVYRRLGATREARCLACPFWVLPAARFRAIAREEGPARTVGRILQRLNK